MEEATLQKNYLSSSWSNQLKGFAIILVLFGHLLLIRFSAAWGVAIFLIVSGFGLTQSYFKSGLGKFFEKRISKVLFPYSFVTIIWILVDRFIYNVKPPISTTLLSVFGINIKCVFDLSMWYITFILFWYLAFYLVFKLLKNNIVRIIALFLIAIVVFKVSNIFPVGVGVPRYAFDFPVGVLLGISYKNIQRLPVKKLLIAQSVICIISFAFFYYLYLGVPTLIKDLFQCLAMGIFVTSFFATLSIYSVRLKFLEWVGSLSFEIYLFEYVFIDKYKFIFNLSLDPRRELVIYFLFIFVLALSYKWLQKAVGMLLGKINRSVADSKAGQ